MRGERIMNYRIIFSLYKKEILDVFRDKKTVILMLFVPLFLYPAMLLGSMLITNQVIKDSQESTYFIGIYSENLPHSMYSGIQHMQ